MKDYNSVFEFWMQNATLPEVRESLLAMKDDETKKCDAFYTDLQFGTAGLRGIMEAGTNRMNAYTVFRATVGVAKYMHSHGFTLCAITYDSRINSQYFSQIAAATLASSGIKVIITKECMPTPFLSFLVRRNHADMGINVTASHNASEYNGYKVYDKEGCQLTDDAANEVTGFIQDVDPFKLEFPRFADYENGLIAYSQSDDEQAYLQSVLKESLNKALSLSAVYSPLNGAGWKMVPTLLSQMGVELTVVPEQAYPDGHFTTCPYPNPEKREALTLALELAKQKDVPLVFANDPDCDRLGVAVKNGQDFTVLTGNEVGLLMSDYILRCKKQQGTLPQKPVIVKTIVSTVMVDALAKKYGVEVVDVLTGFKYIGNAIKNLEDQGRKESFLFGFEESCGYLKGGYVRDKDGVVAAMLICECVDYWQKQGKTLVDRLSELKTELGNFVQSTYRYTFPGAEGAQTIKNIFQGLRSNPPKTLGNSPIVHTTDYIVPQNGLPKSNVLRYNSSDGSQAIIRPSGTEPLVKCYVMVVGSESEVAAKLQSIQAQLDNLMK